MKQRLFPIPLILLTPIILLIIVAVAGIYRLSLSDDEIMAKFPQVNTQADPIVQTVFGFRVLNPITIPVPSTPSVALMETWDDQKRWVLGQYDTGRERGSVALDTQSLILLKDIGQDHVYASVVRISNQGTGVFNYLAIIKHDELRDRMVMVASELLGDRIQVESIVQNGNSLKVTLLSHTNNMSFADAATESRSILFFITEKYQLVRE